MSKVDVLLVSMPFAPLYQPSIGLSLLKASLDPAVISTKILYLKLPFAQIIGEGRYTHIANGIPSVQDLVGEWLFAPALFGADQIDDERYITQVLRRGASVYKRKKAAAASFVQDIFEVRKFVAPFMADCLAEIQGHQPKVVVLLLSFSSMWLLWLWPSKLKQPCLRLPFFWVEPTVRAYGRGSGTPVSFCRCRCVG